MSLHMLTHVRDVEEKNVTEYDYCVKQIKTTLLTSI